MDTLLAPATTTTAVSDATGLLRVMTCGSVDDGKSTLIGRLLHDTQNVLDDQATQLAADSVRHGTAGDAVDYALLLDGLEAEREQGITIDVAYRFITTGTRRIILADSPGHEQYTRNMATAASTADVAIVLIDARRGVLTQTRRHSFIASLMGIQHILLAVNKMDLIDFDQGVFEGIVADYRAAVATAGFATIDAIPISARDGDNVIIRSPRTPWYSGRSLLMTLDGFNPAHARRRPVPHAGAVGVPPRRRLPWLRRNDRDGRRAPGRFGDDQRLRPDGDRGAHRDLRRRPAGGARGRRGHDRARPRDRHFTRRRAGRSRRTACTRRTSSRCT